MAEQAEHKNVSKKSGSLKVIVSGGGTGGHIYPALAIAAMLEERWQAQVLYMGARTDLHGGPAREQQLATAAGYRYIGVTATGLTSKSPRLLKEILQNLRGVREAKAEIRRFAPDIVIGTGGYAMAPVLKAAAGLGIPTLLHEQNAFPGKANRYLAKHMQAICLTFAAAGPHFPQGSKLYVTGLPVRQEIAAANREAAYAYWHIPPAQQKRPTLLVTGGSQGARQLNNALCACYGQLLAQGFRIIHLTGEQHWADCEKAAAMLPEKENLHILPYLKEMHQALAVADLVVSRAGASFLAEIAMLGLPAVLVPYPYAANDHQTHNAQSFVEAGAAVLLKNEDCTAEQLAPLVITLLRDQMRLAAMHKAAGALAQPAAAAEIGKIVEKLVTGSHAD